MCTKNIYVASAAVSLIVLIACGEKKEDSAASRPESTPANAPAAAPAEPSAAPTPSAAPAASALPSIPDGARVFFVEPADGAKVQGPLVDGKVSVSVKMGVEKMEVKPAGQIEAGSGHHHIIIDATSDPEGTVVTKDEQHLHFGQGQTEATLSLTPGQHTLHLQFADGIHRSYGSKLESTVSVTVASGAADGQAAQAATSETGTADRRSAAAKKQEEKNAGSGKKKPPFQPPAPGASPEASKATAQGHEH